MYLVPKSNQAGSLKQFDHLLLPSPFSFSFCEFVCIKKSEKYFAPGYHFLSWMEVCLLWLFLIPNPWKAKFTFISGTYTMLPPSIPEKCEIKAGLRFLLRVPYSKEGNAEVWRSERKRKRDIKTEIRVERDTFRDWDYSVFNGLSCGPTEIK